jgi:serine protease Do
MNCFDPDAIYNVPGWEEGIANNREKEGRFTMVRRSLKYVSCLAVAAVLLSAWLSLAYARGGDPAQRAASLNLTTAIVQVAQQNIPAVAHIEVTQREEVANPYLPFENDPFFQYFFGLPKNMPKKFKRELRGLGSGMLMDPGGHILTNYHVVAGATKIRVILASGEEYSAKVVGTDQKTDLAVISISPKGSLPFVTFGDSDKIKVGEWVVAIGHPRGLDQTVTQGIISAKHRTGITEPSTYEDFLQTDAAINPGNSGGPLLNLRGEVIGVNAVIVSQSGGFEGIGFAIPSNIAVYIAKQLIAHGKIVRGWLGVTVQDLTPELAKSFGAPATTRGALIAEVVKGGPADKAGLQKGDIVIAYQGKEIRDSSTLRNDVAASTIGQAAQVSVLRKGTRQEFRVLIGNLADSAKLLSVSVKDRLGGEFRGVTAKEAERYGLDSGQGAVVTEVDPQGPLGQAGFEVGDIIVEINGQQIDGLEGLISAVNTLKAGQKIAVLALDHRSGNSGYVQVVVR